MTRQKLIVVKVGTNVLTNKDHRISGPVLKELVRQIAVLYEQDILTVLITSGAGMAGKEILNDIDIEEEGIRQQVFCAVGQPRLMRLYYNVFHHFGMRCAQVLATKGDFTPGGARKNLIHCYNGLLQSGITPITNENDATSLQTMFTDNDELAAWVAELLNADQLIFLTDIDGFYNGNPKDKNAQKLATIKVNQQVEQYIQSSVKKGSEGRGGMESKLKLAKETTKKGIDTVMAKGNLNNIIIDIVEGQEVGTRFIK